MFNILNIYVYFNFLYYYPLIRQKHVAKYSLDKDRIT